MTRTVSEDPFRWFRMADCQRTAWCSCTYSCIRSADVRLKAGLSGMLGVTNAGEARRTYSFLMRVAGRRSSQSHEQCSTPRIRTRRHLELNSNAVMAYGGPPGAGPASSEAQRSLSG